jgi:Fe(3+) dicitrate transport protein
LQYGTQFGGLVNFKIKSPTKKPFEFTSRNTIGSYGLLTNFTSVWNKQKIQLLQLTITNKEMALDLTPTLKAKNYFANLNYQLNDKTSLHFDYTYFIT